MNIVYLAGSTKHDLNQSIALKHPCQYDIQFYFSKKRLSNIFYQNITILKVDNLIIIKYYSNIKYNVLALNGVRATPEEQEALR